MKKKILSMFLAVVMLVSVLPMSAISAYATTYSSLVNIKNLNVGDIVKRGVKIDGSMRGCKINGTQYLNSGYTPSTCVKVTSKSGTYEATITNVCNSNTQGTLKTAATCTAAAVYNYKCSYCGYNTATKSVGSPLDHNYAKQGSKVSDATIDSPAIYNKQCETCTATSGTMEVGDKLPSMKVSYLDPITNETVDLGEATNDNVSTAITNLMKTPMQKQDNIFLGWFDSKEKAINKNATRFDTLTNIKANFLGIGYMGKDINDEKNIPYYKTFGLAGVQIRQDNTIELETDEHDTAVYGGLRYVASLSDDIYNNLDIIEYGFVVATRENADANAVASGDEANYVIKNGDKNVKRVNCATSVDHRRFDGNYRLFTMVIDYEGNEALKSTDFVARAYIAYRDANGVARIFYNDYDGTNVYGGCSVSYNRALALM